jgi:hypothetical protein
MFGAIKISKIKTILQIFAALQKTRRMAKAKDEEKLTSGERRDILSPDGVRD